MVLWFCSGKSILVTEERILIIVSIDLKDFFPFFLSRVKGIFRGTAIEGISTYCINLYRADRQVVTLEDDKHIMSRLDRGFYRKVPASPALTNVASMRMDHRLSQYAANNGWRYNYADDLTFLFQSPDRGSGCEPC